MALYKLRVETRSPSGVGTEWTHSYGWTSKKEAQQEADFGNRYLATETHNGTERTLFWFIERED